MLLFGAHWRNLPTSVSIKTKALVTILLLSGLSFSWSCTVLNYEEDELQVVVPMPPIIGGQPKTVSPDPSASVNQDKVSKMSGPAADASKGSAADLTSSTSKKTTATLLSPPKYTRDQLMRQWQEIKELVRLKQLTQDEFLVLCPEVKDVEQQLESRDMVKLTEDIRSILEKINKFSIDAPFLMKKIEKTLIMLNEVPLEPNQYTDFQDEIGGLEHLMQKNRFVEANARLNAIQENIQATAKMNNVLEP